MRLKSTLVDNVLTDHSSTELSQVYSDILSWKKYNDSAISLEFENNYNKHIKNIGLEHSEVSKRFISLTEYTLTGKTVFSEDRSIDDNRENNLLKETTTRFITQLQNDVTKLISLFKKEDVFSELNMFLDTYQKYLSLSTKEKVVVSSNYHNSVTRFYHGDLLDICDTIIEYCSVTDKLSEKYLIPMLYNKCHFNPSEEGSKMNSDEILLGYCSEFISNVQPILSKLDVAHMVQPTRWNMITLDKYVYPLIPTKRLLKDQGNMVDLGKIYTTLTRFRSIVRDHSSMSKDLQTSFNVLNEISNHIENESKSELSERHGEGDYVGIYSNLVRYSRLLYGNTVNTIIFLNGCVDSLNIAFKDINNHFHI